MNENIYFEIARRVVAEAGMIDHRIRRDLNEGGKINAQVGAWARVFDGQPVWPREALDAVHEHYRKPNPFQIMPGDIIEYCKKQPVWSSPEHAAWSLDRWADLPHSPSIAQWTGREWPELDASYYGISDPDALRAHHRALVSERREELISAIMTAKAKPLALN
ncbi:hypothetical protein [Rhodococcus ruber]